MYDNTRVQETQHAPLGQLPGRLPREAKAADKQSAPSGFGPDVNLHISYLSFSFSISFFTKNTTAEGAVVFFCCAAILRQVGQGKRGHV